MAFDTVLGAQASTEDALASFLSSAGLTMQDLLGATADITGLLEDYIAPSAEELLGAVTTLPSAVAAGVDTGFDFTINVINTAGANGALFIDQISAVTQAALANWGKFIIGAPGSSIDVQVTLAPLAPSVIASAGATSISVVDFDGFLVTAQLNTITELTTGIDVNGATPDIVVTVGTGFLFSPAAFLNTDPNRAPPPGAIDYLSVLTHELAHGLGFLDLRDNNFNPLNFTFGLAGGGTITLPTQSTYDAQVDFDPIPPGLYSIDPAGPPLPFDPATTLLGRPFFAGDTVVSLYGERAALEFLANSGGTDLSHFLSNTAPLAGAANIDLSVLTDLAPALMDGFINAGDVIDIGALELAVLRDLGYEVIIPDDLPLINNNDTLFGPNGIFPLPVFTVSEFRIEGDQVVFDVVSSQATAFLTRNAVGLTVGGNNGSFTDRVFAPPVPGAVIGQEAVTTVSIDASSLITGAADAESATGIIEGLLVSLFSPSNAALASGARVEIAQVEASISFTTLAGRGLDATGNILTSAELESRGPGVSAADTNFYAVLGDGDATFENLETAYLLGDTARSGRITRLDRNAAGQDPVTITAQGFRDGDEIGAIQNVRFSNATGFGVASDADDDNGDDAAIENGLIGPDVLNGGESLTFALTGGFGVTGFSFTALASADTIRIAFDTDGGLLFSSPGADANDDEDDGPVVVDAALEIEVAGGARVEIDFIGERILVDGVALVGDFSGFLTAAAGTTQFTVGSLTGPGFSLADVEIERAEVLAPLADTLIASAAFAVESAGGGFGSVNESRFTMHADYLL